jgi:hypothetical protein
MSVAEIVGGEPIVVTQAVSPAVSASRFHALDGVRSTAMLLGVFYHLPIAMMAGGFGMGFDMGGSPKTSIDNWLHSFRMPLFFVISGFFANMIMGKYGWKRYLTRRWWRIGAPLVLAFLAFVGVRIATEAFRPASPSPFSFPAPAIVGGPSPQGPLGAPPQGPRAFGGPGGFGGPPPGGFGGPGPGGFGGPGPGGFGGPGPGGFGGPGPGGFGGPPPGGFGGPGPGGFGGPGPGGFGGPGPGQTGPMQGPPAMPAFTPPTMPGRVWAETLFGSYARFLNLEHLWFLWYLLVFVTIGPCVGIAVGKLTPTNVKDATDRFGEILIRKNLIAIVFGLIAIPALIHARNFMGWSLTNPMVFLAPFPDFVWQYQSDIPYYFLHFLAGWWLYRLRDRLADFGRAWLWSLVIGIAGFAASQALSDRYFSRPDAAYYEWLRIGSFALYGVGAAYTACGFLGFFQRYLDRPSQASRYFADTALWIYLIHMPLIPYLIWWIQPSRTAWWSASLAGMVLVTAVSLVMFELFVRPTPLVHIFGPASLPKRSPTGDSIRP